MTDSDATAERSLTVHGLLVTYQRGEVAVETARRILELEHLRTLTVVDNDPASSAAGMAALDRRVTYLPTGDNLGPAGGISFGVEHLRTRVDAASWIAIFDDDNPPDSTSVLDDHLRLAGAGVGGIGLVGARYSARTGRLRRLKDDELTGVLDVDVVGGGMMPLYRAETLFAAGGPEPSLFFGLEELDLGLRIRAAGWRIVVDGDAWRERRRRDGRTGLPARARRSTVAPPWREYYSTRNQILIARDHAGLLAVLTSVGDGAARLARSLVRRRWTSVRLVALAIAHGVANRRGRCVEPGEGR